MCTVSWLHEADGYLLLCNRDERHTRKPAAGPRIGQRQGVSFIAPVDGDHGGSWIGVNHFGLTLCLLNFYSGDGAEPDRSFTSRGSLLIALLDCDRGTSVCQRVSSADLGQFRPFSMVVLATGEPATLIEWNGHECLVQPDAEHFVPLTSSSLKESDVVKTRKNQFQEMVAQSGQLNEDVLYQFHRSHMPVPGPSSVCMHREDAATVSLSAVRVTAKMSEFTYYGSSPCFGATAEKVVLKRASAGSQVVRMACR